MQFTSREMADIRWALLESAKNAEAYAKGCRANGNEIKAGHWDAIRDDALALHKKIMDRTKAK